MQVVTCIAPVNIALVKYWGKRNEELILPINDSLSVTLSTDEMHAKTTIAASPNFEKDRMWLNGEEQVIDNPRLQNCLKTIRKMAVRKDLAQMNFHICSENNFPTAAGLASSAAGYACLVFTLAHLLDVKGDISAIARLGSGSSCRSLYGGFVRWLMGSDAEPGSSMAVQVATATHWQDLRVLVLVASDRRKHTSSTGAMKRSVETSPLLAYRAKEIVPKRILALQNAIATLDFETVAKITMCDSNQFHAICLDTYPPCPYMNDVSHAVVRMIHAYNAAVGKTAVAYTFDAGPNACVILHQSIVDEFSTLVQAAFPSNSSDFWHGKPLTIMPSSEKIQKILDGARVFPQQNALQFVIHTSIGEGPTVLHGGSNHLLNESGLPKNVST